VPWRPFFLQCFGEGSVIGTLLDSGNTAGYREVTRVFSLRMYGFRGDQTGRPTKILVVSPKATKYH